MFLDRSNLSVLAARGFLPALCLVCLCLTALYGQTPERAKQVDRVLVVHSSTDYYPYSFMDEQGNPKGFAVDMLDLVAKRMHLKIQRIQLPNLTGLEEFKKGRFDIIQQYSRIQEYDAYAEYSVPYFTAQGVLFVRKGEKRFVSLEQARDLKLVVAAAPLGYDYALSVGLKPDQLLRLSSKECLTLLSEGKVDAALLSRITGVAQASQLGLTNVVPSGHPIKGFAIHFCLATHRGDSELLALLNDGVAQLIQAGEFEPLYDKWFAPYEPRRFTWLEMVSFVAVALALALLVVLWALMRQRTLRKRIALQAEELEESRSILAEAQQLAKVGHWQLAIGKTQVTSFAKEVLHILSMDPETTQIDIADLTARIVPADRTRFEGAMKRLKEDGVPYDVDLRLLVEHGAQKTIHIRARCVSDAVGKRIGYLGTLQDITAWKTVEHALEQSERLLRVLYENLPLALGVAERREQEWLLISINPAGVRLLGLVGALTPGTSFSSIGLSRSGQEYLEGLFTSCVEANHPLRLDFARHEDRRDYVISVVPLDGERARICFLIEDVTEHKRKDAEIAQSRRLRAVGELVGGIAHEFNNLLTPILANADLLQTEWAHERELSAELKVIADAARRSAELTRRLLAFGRKSDRAVEPVDLREVVAANVELVRHTFDRRITIDFEIPDALPRLRISGGDLHQILLNLLVNARDSFADKLENPPGEEWRARIHIKASLHGPAEFIPLEPLLKPTPEAWVRLTVSDNGCGMPPSVIERIYEPFYTTKEVGRGTGLGLATIWHLIAEYGGRIDVDSKQGVGSSFYICLPTSSSKTPSAEHLNVVFNPSDKEPSRRILLVEDEESICRILSLMLKKLGHTTTVATDGRIAWDLFGSVAGGFDAVIMDLNMPGMSGLELARLLRTTEFRGPILVISGRVSDEDRHALALLGITTILHKPFTGDEVRSALWHALHG